MDLMDPPKGLLNFLEKMHDYYCRLLTKWAETDVDALNMMDDWGSQNDLLISPKVWDEIFRPMYQDSIIIAHSYGTTLFMHSGWNTLFIIPPPIDLGPVSKNRSLFCMSMAQLAQHHGLSPSWV